MWIITTDGFFSVVQNSYCGPDELAVRGRRLDDLERFVAATGTDATVLTFPEADYKYRVQVRKSVWANYLSGAARHINYDNFKSKIAKNGDRQLAHALHDVWHDLCQLQQ